MTSAAQDRDEKWLAYADMADEAREPQMLARFQEIAALDEEERVRQIGMIARAEYSLDNERLKSLSKSRLRVFLKLNKEEAERIAAAYDVVMRSMPGDAAMRRVTIVQSLATEFSPEEEEQLVALLPNVFAGAPGRRGVVAAVASVSSLARNEEPQKRKPFWMFWSR